MIADRAARAQAAYIRVLVALVARVIAHPLIALAIALLLSIGSTAFVVTHFAIDTDTTALLSRDLGFQQDEKALDTAFPQLRDNIVAVVDGHTPGQAEMAADKLAAWASHRPKDFQSVYEPGGGPFFAKNGLLYLSTADINRLGDRLSQAQPLIATLANDPSLAGLFGLLDQALTQKSAQPPADLNTLFGQIAHTVAAYNRGQYAVVDWQKLMASAKSGPLTSTRRFVLIKPNFDYSRLQPGAVPIAHLRAAIAQHSFTDAGSSIRLTGPAVLNNEQLGAVSKGAGLATGVALALVLILLIVALRSAAAVAATVITLTAGLIWTTAFGLVAIGQFNILSVAFAVLFVGLSVDFGIQYCMRVREVAARPVARDEVLIEATRGIGGPLTLAGLAAAASFFSVVPTDYAGLADLGVIAGASMIIAVAANLTLLPALLRLFGADKPRDTPRVARGPRLSYAPLGRWNRVIVAVAVVAGLASIPEALSIRFDFNPLSLENQHSVAMQTLNELLHSGHFSPYSINILEPNLARAKRVAAQLDKRPTVDHAVTLASYVPKDQSEKLGTIGNLALVVSPSSLEIGQLAPPDPGRARTAIEKLRADLATPGGPAADHRLDTALGRFLAGHGQSAQAYGALEHRLLGTLPHQLGMLKKSFYAQKVTLADLPADLKSRYVAADGRARVEVFSKLNLSSNANLARFVADVRAVVPDAAGTPVLLVEGGHAVTRAFAQASLTALVAIALLLWLVLRRWRDVALALAPLPLAGVLTAATMVLAGIAFDLANIIVLPLLIGLGVAYGIYFVTRWQDGHSLAEMLESTTPSAVLFSALTTASSFGSLAFADSPGMAILGKTLSIALAWILVTTLLVLPALLSLFTPSAPRQAAPRS